MASHPINISLGSLEVTSSSSTQVPNPNLTCETPIKSPSLFVPVTDLFTALVSPVTSPLCPMPPGSSTPPLKTTQTMSHEQPVDAPIEPKCPQSAFVEEVDDEDTFVLPPGPDPDSHETVQHVNDPVFINDPEPLISVTAH